MPKSRESTAAKSSKTMTVSMKRSSTPLFTTTTKAWRADGCLTSLGAGVVLALAWRLFSHAHNDQHCDHVDSQRKRNAGSRPPPRIKHHDYHSCSRSGSNSVT